jgi:ABC-type glycerol-3-phosphate transport system substrate-binding protein
MNDFIPFARDEATLCGHLYGLPIFTDCCLLMWRKDIFKEVGLDPEQPPTSLEEMMECVEKVTKRRSDGSLERIGIYPHYLHYGWAYHWIGTPSKPEGVNFWDFEKETAACDDPRIVECAEWMQDVAETYNVDMVDSFREAWGGGETDAFGMGQQAMSRKGDWMIKTYERYFPEMDYGVARMPIPSEYGGVSNSSCGGGWGMVIPVGAKQQDAAWEVSAYITSEEGMEFYCRNNRQIPVRKSVAEKEFNREEPHHVPYMDVLPDLWCRPPIPAGQVLWTEILGAGDLILHGKDAKTALKDVNKRVNEAMEDFNCDQLKV